MKSSHRYLRNTASSPFSFVHKGSLITEVLPNPAPCSALTAEVLDRFQGLFPGRKDRANGQS